MPDTFGCEYSLKYLYKLPLPAGGVQANKAGLQSPASNISGSQAEFTCLLTDSRFLFGVGFDSESKKYYLRDGVSRDFESDYKSLYLRAGYSYEINESLSSEFSLKVGHGKFKFHESGVEERTLSDIYSVGADARIVKPYDIGKLKIDFIGGAGIQKTFVPSFQYNGRNFSSDEFGVGANFFLGIGFRF